MLRRKLDDVMMVRMLLDMLGMLIEWSGLVATDRWLWRRGQEMWWWRLWILVGWLLLEAHAWRRMVACNWRRKLTRLDLRIVAHIVKVASGAFTLTGRQQADGDDDQSA